jgi:hypothetical protein
LILCVGWHQIAGRSADDVGWLRYALGKDLQSCIATALATLGALWTVVEIASYFVGDLRPIRLAVVFPGLICTSLVIGARMGVRPRSVVLPIGSSDTVVAIEIGDIFAVPGARVIPVNDFLDYDLSRHVAPVSLHGQFLLRCFPGREQAFRDQTDEALAHQPAELVERPSGRDKRYPVGTLTRVTAGEEDYMLLVLTRTDVITLKASADTDDLWRALAGLWSQARYLSFGKDVVVPLIGSGLSGVGLPVGRLLDMLLISLVDATKTRKVADRVVVVLTESHLDQIDLRDVSRVWQS